jgi:DNA-binding XRE family transcriptional regulator
VKKKNEKNQKNQKKAAKKLALQRETLSVLEEGKLADVAGGATHCPTGCSVC